VLGGFPRHLTTDLIDEESAHRARREQIGGWVLGVALALFALALPQERLHWSLEADGSNGLSLLGQLWHAALQQLGDAAGTPSELLALSFSAICYGACLPLALSFGRRLGIPFVLTLLASSLVLFSPAAWICATSPGLGSLALFVGLLLMRELWRDGEFRPGLVTLLWSTGAFLHGGLLLSLEAVLGSIRSRAPGEAANRLTRLLRSAVILVFLLGTWVLVQAIGAVQNGGLADTWSHAFLAAYLPGLTDLGALLDHVRAAPRLLLDLPIYIGFLVIGLAGLLLVKREEAEQPPPRWLWVWIGLPLVLSPIWSHMHAGDASLWLWLLPPALVACLDLTARQDPKPAILGAGIVLALQLGLLAGVLRHRAQTDPLADWRDSATLALNPDDWVVTDVPAHRYLLRERWDVDCMLVGPSHDPELVKTAALLAARSGRRVVLDLGPGEHPPALASLVTHESEISAINDLLIFRAVPEP
jgi:hypothetical protein